MPKAKKKKKGISRRQPYVDWNTRYNQLEEYRKEHKHCKVPRKHPQLGNWVMSQRALYHKTRKGTLSSDQIKLLNGIGFEWELHQKHVIVGWDERFEQLNEYKQVNGHCDVPQKYEANPKLGQWVSHQRNAYRKAKLSKERIESLQSLGFSWNPDEDKWNEMYEELKQYKQEHGHCRVPNKYRTNPQLGQWVDTQRQAYKKQGTCKITGEQIEHLNDIGFEWELRKVVFVGWDERFQQLVEYNEVNGNCRVPQRFKGNPQLGLWVDTQRTNYKKGKLSPERIESLERLGFKWVLGRGRRQAREVSGVEDSVSGGEEEAGGATSSGDTQIMIPSLPLLPSVAADDTLIGVDNNGGEDTNGDMLTDEYQEHNQQQDVEEEEFANDGSSFHMDEDHQEYDEEENDGINVSQQEGGRSSSVESQQDLEQKLDEANARIASLQPNIVDLTNEDSTNHEDNNKEAAGTKKSVEATILAYCKVKQEKLDEKDKKIAAAEEKVAAAEKKAELAEKRASAAEQEKEDAKQDAGQLKSLAEEALQECDNAVEAVEHAEKVAEEALQECDNALRRAACRMCNTVEHRQFRLSPCGCIMCWKCIQPDEHGIAIGRSPCPYGCTNRHGQGRKVMALQKLNTLGR